MGGREGGEGWEGGGGLPEPVLRWKVALVAIRKLFQKSRLCFIYGERGGERGREREEEEDRETDTETERESHRQRETVRDKSMVLSQASSRLVLPLANKRAGDCLSAARAESEDNAM